MIKPPCRSPHRRQSQKRARELKVALATPKWVDTDALLAIHDNARWLRSVGVDARVDHTIPICGENVCGLNVPWNLQLIDHRDNLVKGNRHESDGPRGRKPKQRRVRAVKPEKLRIHKPRVRVQYEMTSNPKHVRAVRPCRKCNGHLRYSSTRNCVPCAKNAVRRKRGQLELSAPELQFLSEVPSIDSGDDLL